MTVCSFCGKEYKPYLVILCSKIECFVMEMHWKDMYYNGDKGVCKECRDTKLLEPVRVWRALLNVEMRIMLAKDEAEKEGDKKRIKNYEKAINRCKKWNKRLEKTKEVQAVLKVNAPYLFKKKPTKKTLCTYCGQNFGQEWINNPNHPVMEGDEECWWVCKPCVKLIDLQQEYSHLSYLKFKTKSTSKKLSKRISSLKEEINSVAYEDGQEVFGVEITKKNNGLHSKRLY